MSSDIEKLELSIEEARKMVARKEALERLTNNRDYQEIFLEGYFKDEALRLTRVLGDHGLAAHRAEITIELQAVSKVQQHLRNVISIGTMAQNEIGEAEIALDELRQAEALEGAGA